MNRTGQGVAPTIENPELDVPAPGQELAPHGDGDQGGMAYVWLLWDQRRFLFRCAAAGLVLATLIAFVLPKRYTSTTRIIPPDPQSLSTMAMLSAAAQRVGGGSLGGAALDFLGVKNNGAIIVAILQSRTVGDHMIDRFDLMKEYWAGTRKKAREKLAKRTALDEDRKSGVITIAVTDSSPYRAAAMAHAYVDELNTLSALLNTSAAHRERIFIEGRLVAVKQELDTAAKEFSEFSSKNTAIDIKEQGKAMVEAAAVLQGQLIAAESELQGLEQIYTDNNVRVRSLRARVQELRSQLNKIGGTDASLNSATSGGASASGAPADIYPSIRKLPLLGVRWADLYRRTRVEETVYELLTQQYELAKIQEAKELPSIKVMDEADVPEKKSFPPRMLLMGLGTVLAFIFGTLWLLGSEMWVEWDPRDERKMFLEQVLNSSKKTLRAVRDRLGIRPGAAARLKFWKRQPPADEPKVADTD